MDVAASGGIGDNVNPLAIPKSTKTRGTQKAPKKGHSKYHSKSAANRLLKACEDLLIAAQCTIDEGMYLVTKREWQCSYTQPCR